MHFRNQRERKSLNMLITHENRDLIKTQHIHDFGWIEFYYKNMDNIAVMNLEYPGLRLPAPIIFKNVFGYTMVGSDPWGPSDRVSCMFNAEDHNEYDFGLKELLVNTKIKYPHSKLNCDVTPLLIVFEFISGNYLVISCESVELNLDEDILGRWWKK